MRKIVIGDVHGCLDELQQLVEILKIQEEDEVVFVGDLLDKGPDSLGVWRFVQDAKNFNQAKLIFVWGNHEDKHYRYLKNPSNFNQVSADLLVQQNFTQQDKDLFDAFVMYHYDPRFHLFVIHGGLLPNIKSISFFMYEKATEYYKGDLSNKKLRPFILNTKLRYLSKDHLHFVSLGQEKVGDPFWAEIYDGCMGKIVFGHEAFLEPQEFSHAIGVDTGCVYGNKLTAAVFEGDSKIPKYISVNSKQQYSQSKHPLTTKTIQNVT